MATLLGIFRRLFDSDRGYDKSELLLHKQSFRNDLDKPFEVMIEPMPDRYMLFPGQQIEVEVKCRSDWNVFERVIVYGGGIWIDAATVPAKVRIDGEPAKTDWKSPGPNATRKG